MQKTNKTQGSTTVSHIERIGLIKLSIDQLVDR